MGTERLLPSGYGSHLWGWESQVQGPALNQSRQGLEGGPSTFQENALPTGTIGCCGMEFFHENLGMVIVSYQCRTGKCLTSQVVMEWENSFPASSNNELIGNGFAVLFQNGSKKYKTAGDS